MHSQLTIPEFVIPDHILAITDDPLCFWYFTANFISYTG